MSKLNNKEATIEGLLALGFVEDKGRSKKYRCFDEQTPTGVPCRTWLVGKSGALRLCPVGRPSIHQSISKTDTLEHRAFRYCGRIREVVSDGISLPQYRDIWNSIAVRKQIPVTKDGYHADRKE